MFGSTVYIAIGIHFFASDGAKVDDMPLLARRHDGRYHPRDIKQPFHIGVDHAIPITDVACVYRVEPLAQARVVNQYIHLFPLLGEVVEGSKYLIYIADIERQEMNLYAKNRGKLRSQCFHTGYTACGKQEVITLSGEHACTSFADTGTGPRNECYFVVGHNIRY